MTKPDNEIEEEILTRFRQETLAILEKTKTENDKVFDKLLEPYFEILECKKLINEVYGKLRYKISVLRIDDVPKLNDEIIRYKDIISKKINYIKKIQK